MSSACSSGNNRIDPSRFTVTERTNGEFALDYLNDDGTHTALLNNLKCGGDKRMDKQRWLPDKDVLRAASEKKQKELKELYENQRQNGSTNNDKKTKRSCLDYEHNEPIDVPASPITRSRRHHTPYGVLQTDRLSKHVSAKLEELKRNAPSEEMKYLEKDASDDELKITPIDTVVSTKAPKSQLLSSKSEQVNSAKSKEPLTSVKAARSSRSPVRTTSSKPKSALIMEPQQTGKEVKISNQKQTALTASIFGDADRINEVSEAIGDMCEDKGLQILCRTMIEIPK